MSGVSRVIIVNNFPGPGMGGGEVQLLTVVEALISAGMHVQVVAVPRSAFAERCRELGAQVTMTPMTLARFWAASRVVRGVAERVAVNGASGGRPVLMGTGYLTNMLVRVAATGLDVAVLNQIAVLPGASGLDGGSVLGLWLRSMASRATAGRVDRYVAVSTAVSNALVRQGIAPELVTVIMNGVDTEALGRVTPIRVPGADGAPVVACVSRLETVKGVEHLVRAAVHVPDAIFAIAGTGSQESRLREVAVAAGVSQRIRLLGHVDSAPGLLAAADVVAVPSLSEAFGLVAAEAMAVGKPVVASAVGGLAEVVADGTTGVLVPPGDQQALAAAIRALLGDPSAASAMGEAGRKRAAELFSEERMAAEYVDLIRGLSRSRP